MCALESYVHYSQSKPLHYILPYEGRLDGVVDRPVLFENISDKNVSDNIIICNGNTGGMIKVYYTIHM